ncbi:MAG: hypothetical protein HDQ93_03345 [Desulfovibrio sp.]|nr:hypothetical protein [Desulfovibrio sp.]
MSGEIVAIGALAPLAASAAASVLIAAAPLAIGGALLYGAGKFGATAMEEASKRRREARRREMEALSQEVSRLARSAAKKSPPVLSREFIEENRKSIENALSDLDLESAVLDIDAYKKTESGPDEPDAARECRELYASIALMSESIARACDSFMTDIEAAPKVRQKAIRDNLRFEYGRAVREKSAALWRKRKAEEGLASLSGDDAIRFESALADAGYPDDDLSEAAFDKLQKVYAALIEEDARRKQNALLERQMIADMKNLGYSPVGAAKQGAPILFYTGEKDYRVMARVNPENGQLSLRFVRVVASEEEKNSATTAQKRRDLEQEKKWCANATKLLAALSAETGMELKELYRKEPEEGASIMTIVDESLAERKNEIHRRAEN